MRRILEAGDARWVVPLVLLAMFSSWLSDLDADHSGFREALESISPAVLASIVIAGILVAIPIMLALFYLFAWIAAWVGRLLEGDGTVRRVRVALAWSLAPVIWALLYRIPVAVWMLTAGTSRQAAIRIVGDDWVIRTGGLVPSIGGILLLLANLIVFVWYLIVASRCVGEAHHFSSWKGLATLLLALAAPVILIAAIVLAAVTS